MENEKLQYSDFKDAVLINDWPYGNKRVKCLFEVEQGKGKERAVRTTENPKTGKMNKPKKMTYARKVLFATGSDGKLYIVQSVGWAYSIMQSNMKYSQEYIGVEDDRYIGIAQNFDDLVTTTVNTGE